VVLVDSSVWIDFFNGDGNPQTARLDTLLSSTIVVVGDIVLAEVLQGFKREADFRMAKRLLLSLDTRVIGSIEIALKAADNFRTLRKKGVTVRKTVDCLIATFCIERRVPLLYKDRDYDPFVRHLGLRSAM
jgi:predicted nucleic acid-binding protein